MRTRSQVRLEKVKEEVEQKEEESPSLRNRKNKTVEKKESVTQEVMKTIDNRVEEVKDWVYSWNFTGKDIFPTWDELEPLRIRITKFVVAILYFLTVMFASALSMTFTNTRVPDRDRYPPLPDLGHEYIPYMEHAFEAAEICLLSLGFIFGMLLLFHKRRHVLIRRFCAIVGSVFALRCVSMSVTALSVPGEHIHCHPASQTREEIFAEAWTTFLGAGLSVNGVRTCGDYFFSGHTVMLTSLCIFICEYTPWKNLHTFCWVLCSFGMFFVVASREHYTLDVVAAFYITSKSFYWYHAMANTGQDNIKQYQTYFPLFWFLERHTKGVIRDEYILFS